MHLFFRSQCHRLVVALSRRGFNKGPIRLPEGSFALFLRRSVPLISISYEQADPFHGGNTGSNPVGDANKINGFRMITVFLHDPI